MTDFLSLASDLARNPWLALAGFLVTVFSLALAVIFYLRSRKRKLIRYAVRSTNMVKGLVSKIESLEMLYKGQRVEDLTVTRIAIWNAGEETINSDDVASGDPLCIRVGEGLKVLDEKILSIKNPTNQFAVERCPDQQGVVMKFDYLDSDEGAVIQIFHTGTSSDQVKIEGTIKGLGKVPRTTVPPFKRKLTISLPPPFKGTLAEFGVSGRTFGALLLISTIVVGSFLILVPDAPPRPVSFRGKVLPVLLGTLPYWAVGLYYIKRRMPRGFEAFEKEL